MSAATATDLAATLRRLTQRADPAPWTSTWQGDESGCWEVDPICLLCGDTEECGPNAEFIAWCRNNAEAIASALERGAAAEAVLALGRQLNAPLHLVPDASQLMRDRALFVAYDAALAAYDALTEGKST